MTITNACVSTYGMIWRFSFIHVGSDTLLTKSTETECNYGTVHDAKIVQTGIYH